MKKIALTIVVLLSIQLLSAQKSLSGFKNSLKISSSSIKDVIPIINENNDDIVLFFADTKNVYG